MDRLCILFGHVPGTGEPPAHCRDLDRQSIVAYWKRVALAVLDGESTLFAAFVGNGIFGSLEYRAGRGNATSADGESENLLVDSRFRREEVTAALHRALEAEVRTRGAVAVPDGEGDVPSSMDRAGARMAARTGILPPPKPHEGRSGIRIRDQIAVVPTRDLAGSKSFYQNQLGLTFLSYRYMEAFLDAGGGLLLLRLVDRVDPLPWPIVEWCVQDLPRAILELRARRVRIEHQTLFETDRLGIFKFPDGGRGAIIRDPEGNLLTLREPVPGKER